jgi:hypothetical protein
MPFNEPSTCHRYELVMVCNFSTIVTGTTFSAAESLDTAGSLMEL